jgi:hypothetical protein
MMHGQKNIKYRNFIRSMVVQLKDFAKEEQRYVIRLLRFEDLKTSVTYGTMYVTNRGVFTTV